MIWQEVMCATLFLVMIYQSSLSTIRTWVSLVGQTIKAIFHQNSHFPRPDYSWFLTLTLRSYRLKYFKTQVNKILVQIGIRCKTVILQVARDTAIVKLFESQRIKIKILTVIQLLSDNYKSRKRWSKELQLLLPVSRSVHRWFWRERGVKRVQNGRGRVMVCVLGFKAVRKNLVTSSWCCVNC